MTILNKEQVAEWREANWFADNDDCADKFRALCDNAELGLRAIEMEQRIRQFIEGELDALSPEKLARCNIHKLSDYGQGQRDLLNRLKRLISD
jgi:hypothetical protein